MSPHETLTFPRDARAPAEVRRALDELLADLPLTIQPLARLLASELTANAVQHGEGGEIRVQVLRRSGRLMIEVVDDGPGFAPPSQTGGFGLRLVESLAERWGVEEGQTRVWFELPLE